MHEKAVSKLPVTFRSVVNEWFVNIKKPRIIARSTLANYENAIRLHLLPFFPEEQLICHVQRADLQRCVDACASYSATVGKLVRSVIISTMKYALSEQLISFDPSMALVLPSARKTAPRNTLTPEQEKAVLQAAASSPDGLMIYLLYYTGIRRGEMLGLKWGDVDFTRRLIHIQRSVDLSVSPSSASIAPLKTDASNRWLPVPSALEQRLLPLQKAQDELIISSADHTPLNAAEFRLRWNRLMFQAGCADLSASYRKRADKSKQKGRPVPIPQPARDYQPHITPHCFRHHYITACVTAGLKPEVTMRLAGHSSYQTTIDIYTHLQTNYLQAAASALTDILCADGCRHVAGCFSEAPAP